MLVVWVSVEVELEWGEGDRQQGDLTGTEAGGSERGRGEGSSLTSGMTWFRMFGLAWSDGKVKALNFSNSIKKLSRKDDGVGANGFAGGHQSVRDSHPWAVPWMALSSGPESRKFPLRFSHLDRDSNFLHVYSVMGVHLLAA